MLRNVISTVTGDAQKIAKHVFKAKVLYEILDGTCNLYINAPTMTHPNPLTFAVELVIATRADIPGQIVIYSLHPNNDDWSGK